MRLVSGLTITAQAWLNGVLGLVAFLPVAFPKLTPIAVLFLGFTVGYLYLKKQVEWKVNLPAFMLMLLYAVYLIWILFADDKANGLKYAEYKLAFLIFPLLLSIKPKFKLPLHGAVTGLIVGILVAALPGIVQTMDCVDEHNRFMYCYTSSRISVVHHPSYFAAFLLVAVAGAWKGYSEKWKGFTLFVVTLFTCWAAILYFLCMSLAGILFLVILLFVFFVFWFFSRFGKRIGLLFLVISPLFVYLLVSSTPGVKEEFNNATDWTLEYVKSPETYLEKRAGERELQGNHVRLVMWTVTSELILEHPLGVGTGDVDAYINSRLAEYGFDELVAQDLNSHNQYLQTTLETGVLGLSILLVLIGSAWRVGWENRSWLLLVVVAGLAFNALFESFLQRQSGVVFYSFWIPFLVSYLKSSLPENRN